MKTVLIIDDNSDFRETVAGMLTDADYDVYEANCPDNAFKLLQHEVVDLIICDLHMPFTEGEKQREFLESKRVGIETIRELGWVFPQTPIIAVSAAPASDLMEAAKELGDIPVLPKPFNSRVLMEHVVEASKHDYTGHCH